MIRGSIPYDGGNLLLSEMEALSLKAAFPEAAAFLRRYGGAAEMLSGVWRYCLWLANAEPAKLRAIPPILEKIRLTHEFRSNSKTAAVRRKIDFPAEFGDIRQPADNYLLLPRVSSERRFYMPIGYYDVTTIVADSAYAIPNATLYHFGILMSRMHMVWMRAVAGRLESRYRYSKDIVYNNFVWPEVDEVKRTEVERLSQAVLNARAEFPEASLADLYDPLSMPPALARAHHTLDRYVDRLYRPEGFQDDPARVSHLFALYQEKIDEN